MPLVSSKVHMDIEFKGGASDLIRPRRVVIPPLSGIVSANIGESDRTIADRAAPDTHSLLVSAFCQNCNNKLCLPPKKMKAEVPVTVGE